jgi:aspartate aminotransferase
MPEAPGSIYVFPNIRSFRISSSDMADLLLEKAGVAVLPGSAFGKYGEGYLRLAYSNSLERIRAAIDQINASVSKIHQD